MRYTFNEEKMYNLLQNFYNLMNGRYTLFDNQKKLVFSVGKQSTFCEKIIMTRIGSANCEADDILHLEKAVVEDTKGVYVYICHCGVLNSIIPIRDENGLMGYLVFGQFIDDSSVHEQWEYIQNRLQFFPELDLQEMKTCFSTLPQYSINTIISCSDVLSACTEYIRRECFVPIESKNLDDLLTNYIASNYSRQLSLKTIADNMHVSKSKLCSIAASRGTTITHLINEQRMKAAAIRLVTTSNRISEIATEVGIDDYNYFTKLFRKHYNCTPKDYRREHAFTIRVDKNLYLK